LANDLIPLPESAAGPTLLAAVDATAAFIAASRSPATCRAYASDWRDFESWCARQSLITLPASPGALVPAPMPHFVVMPIAANPDVVCGLVAQETEVREAAVRWDRARDLVAARLATQGRIGIPVAERAPLYSGEVDDFLMPVMCGLEAGFEFRDRPHGVAQWTVPVVPARCGLEAGFEFRDRPHGVAQWTVPVVPARRRVFMTELPRSQSIAVDLDICPLAGRIGAHANSTRSSTTTAHSSPRTTPTISEATAAGRGVRLQEVNLPAANPDSALHRDGRGARCWRRAAPLDRAVPPRRDRCR
jgi:hypothetical protein